MDTMDTSLPRWFMSSTCGDCTACSTIEVVVTGIGIGMGVGVGGACGKTSGRFSTMAEVCESADAPVVPEDGVGPGSAPSADSNPLCAAPFGRMTTILPVLFLLMPNVNALMCICLGSEAARTNLLPSAGRGVPG